MNRSQKIELVKILLSASLLAAGMAAEIFWFYPAAYIVVGYRAIVKAILRIVRGRLLDENFLMTAASLGAFYCGEYPEAVVVMLFYTVGSFFEDFASEKSRKSIRGLMDLKADFARRITGGREETVKPGELKKGDILLIRPGEKIPVDGIVTDGFSSLNTAPLTGESAPRDVAAGSEVLSGAVNLDGVLRIRVTSAYEDSTASRILDLVENASGRKAPVEKFITRFARFYTPAVVTAALLLAAVPPMVLGFRVFRQWFYTAMIFLVASCPCSLVISVPLSLFAGIGSASKHGILVRGGNFLESLARVKTMVFDKTGTLTTGRFSVTEICPAEGVSGEELLETAAYGESLSNHPIALAVKECYGRAVQDGVKDYREIPGKGITAVYKGKRIYCGSSRLMDELGLPAAVSGSAGSTVHAAEEGKYLGYITATDTLRENAAKTVAALKEAGIRRIVMLTGDRSVIARDIGEKAGIDSVLSDLLPGDKVKAMEKLKEENPEGKAAFVGDGINDAPVLACADVGIAMGALGSDAAVEAADVVILNDDISRVFSAVKIAKKTLAICRQNVIFALVIKFAVLLLSLLGLTNMWEAVFADVGLSFISILNGMRAMKL